MDGSLNISSPYTISFFFYLEKRRIDNSKDENKVFAYPHSVMCDEKKNADTSEHHEAMTTLYVANTYFDNIIQEMNLHKRNGRKHLLSFILIFYGFSMCFHSNENTDATVDKSQKSFIQF